MSTTLNEETLKALSGLFNEYRIAQLNRRYYVARLEKYALWDKSLQIVVGVVTAASFAILLFTDFSKTKIVAAILSAVAFVFSVVIPSFGLNRSIEETKQRSITWHFAVQQLENSLRLIKKVQSNNGEVAGLFKSAEHAYSLAAALPDTESDNMKLIQKLEEEINQSFPPDYVWKAL
jgi:hypothetical protein